MIEYGLAMNKMQTETYQFLVTRDNGYLRLEMLVLMIFYLRSVEVRCLVKRDDSDRLNNDTHRIMLSKSYNAISLFSLSSPVSSTREYVRTQK